MYKEIAGRVRPTVTTVIITQLIINKIVIIREFNHNILVTSLGERSERYFSTTECIIDKQLSSLTSQTVNSLVLDTIKYTNCIRLINR